MTTENYAKILINISNKPMFSIEGIDDSGKTTQAKLVSDMLNELGISAKNVTSPSESLVGRFLRANLSELRSWEKASLFLLDIVSILKENENFDGILIWDRYKDSNIVSNKDISMEEAIAWNMCLPDAIKTFLLDITPIEVYNNRALSDDGHSKNLAWQNLKYSRYQELYKNNESRFIKIDARPNRELIASQIVQNIVSEMKGLKSL